MTGALRRLLGRGAAGRGAAGRARSDGAAQTSDVTRQTTVAVSAVVGVAGALLGSGAFVGTPIAEAAGGALAADATLVAPASTAFSIWAVIYAGLVGLAAYQFLPGQRADPRQRQTGWLVAASLLLNAAWILTVQAGSVTGSLVVIVVLLAVLVALLARLLRRPPTSTVQAVLLDATLGLYLGWVSIATVANAAAALDASGADPGGTASTLWSVVVLLGAGALGVFLAAAGRGRLTPPAALAWGLLWICVARTTGEPQSAPAAATAAVSAVATVLAVVVLRARRRSGGGRRGPGAHPRQNASEGR